MHILTVESSFRNAAAVMQVCRYRAGSDYMIRFHWFPGSFCCKTTREDPFNKAKFNSLIVSPNLKTQHLRCGDGRRHIFEPSLAVHCSPARPSYWHIVTLYPLLITQFSRTTSVQISMRRARRSLTSSDFKLSIKNKILAFLSVWQGHIFWLH